MQQCSKIVSVVFFLLCFCTNLHAAKEKKPAKSQDSFEQVVTLLFRGKHPQALELIEIIKEKKSKGIWRSRLDFLAAYLNLKSGDYGKALEFFQKIDADYPLKDNYVAFYEAVALREAGKGAESIQLFEKLKQRALSSYLSGRIDRELALSYCQAKDRARGVDLLNQLIQTETYPIKTYHLRYDRARCLMLMGDNEEAAASLTSLYLTYPEGDLSGAILSALEKIRPDRALTYQDHLSRADQLLRNKRADLAVIDLEKAASLSGGTSLELKSKMAEAYFKARRYPEAASAYESLRQIGVVLSREDVENLAKAYSRSDQFDQAIAIYQELLNSDPAKTSTYLYKIAFLWMDKGDSAGAIQKFTSLLDEFPKHSQKEQILWYLAWNHYLLNQPDPALAYLDQLESLDARFLSGKGLSYWRARFLEKKGQKSGAQAIFQDIAAEDPVSYYGFLSSKRLEANAPPDKPPQKASGELPRRKIPPSTVLKAGDAASKSAAGRLQEMLFAGLWEDFLGELNDSTRNEGLPSALAEIQSGLQSEEKAGVSESGDYSQRYPPVYPTLVIFFSQSRRIPASLTWAIMREESHFRPTVVSPAQAIGLMQIIPPTGFEIARDLGRRGFTPDDLYQPVVNIEYGAHYLAKNLERFNNNLVHTIASYNAGPEAIERWARSRPNREWDEFVEEIPYKETNNYVKKVLKSYYIYSLMYQ